jgi:hypothetical protein
MEEIVEGFCESCLEENSLLKARIEELEEAIRKHRDQTGNNLCWENDRELWSILSDTPDTLRYPHETLPDQEEFLTNCQRYYASRLCQLGRKHDSKQ